MTTPSPIARELYEALTNLLAVKNGEGGTRYHSDDIARAAIAKYEQSIADQNKERSEFDEMLAGHKDTIARSVSDLDLKGLYDGTTVYIPVLAVTLRQWIAESSKGVDPESNM